MPIRMDKWIFLAASLIALAACSGGGAAEKAVESEPPSAQQIVDAAIAKHGGARYQQFKAEFDFRGRHYTAARNGAQFTYERIFTDTTGRQVRDVLRNEGLYREVDGQRAQLSEKDSAAYANSVNSVLYFALLPAFLNDPAVVKEYAGEATIKGQPYHKVGVTFRQEGGGKDFDDEYMYWIHRDSATMDYLAYNYQVDGGGARFREAYNVRTVGGLRFADYRNYKPKTDNRKVAEFDLLFENEGLELLSNIETENIAMD